MESDGDYGGNPGADQPRTDRPLVDAERRSGGGESAGRPRRPRHRSRPAAPIPNPSDAVLVESRDELARHCARWCQAPVVALDTEFVRERTFYAQLGLIQVADDRGCWLVDAVRIDDLAPLAELLARPETLKVVHSGGEDLEVMHQQFGLFPHPLFDTQIAATLAGHGGSLGYQKLVQVLFRLELPKGETRSDWLRRPLSEAQLEYAILDVAYLPQVHRLLSRELAELDRAAWAEEEFDRLVESTRARSDPDYSFRRLSAGTRLGRRDRALLHDLCTWRESEARRRDVPRGFVMPDATVMQLVRRRPIRSEQLTQIKGLKASERARSGDEILQRIREVLRLPEATLPAVEPKSPPSGGRKREVVNGLRAEVQLRAEELRLPPEFLARRRLVEELVGNVRDGRRDPLPEELEGWRREVIGDRLVELAHDLLAGGER